MSRLAYSVNVLPVQDLSPGNIEEAEEAEPDDEFKDAIEVRKTVCLSIHLSVFLLFYPFVCLSL